VCSERRLKAKRRPRIVITEETLKEVLTPMTTAELIISQLYDESVSETSLERKSEFFMSMV
jgi:hypothetical protein